MTDQKIIKEITALLEDISCQTQEFARTTGLRCRSGCGHCCENPQVETTVTEMLPLAVDLWAKGEAEQALAAIAKTQAQGTCIFYKPDPFIAGNGRCSIYAHRPGVCRSFGFSTQTDKYGKAKLVTCSIIKNAQPDQCSAAQKTLDAGAKAPLISGFAFKVFNIDPIRGKELLPINKAALLALEHVGMALDI